MALEQVAFFQAAGVDAAHVVIGHVDRKLEVDYHLRVAATGVYLGFDQIGKTKYASDAARADIIAHLVAAGHGRQLLLAGDLARRSYWPSYGASDHAIGFTHILTHFVPCLYEAGLTQAQVDDLLIHNPARAFAMTAG